MKTYKDALQEILDFIKKPDETWDPLGPISTIQNWIENKLEENIDVGQPLSKFKSGDILYSYENEDFFACIFKLKGNIKDVINSGDYLVQENGIWMLTDSEFYSIYDEEGVFYRLATPEEIKMFNSRTIKK